MNTNRNRYEMDYKKSRLSPMTCHIDSADTDADGFYICGWYIDDGSVKLSVFDPEGNPLSFELKKNKKIGCAGSLSGQ